MDPAGTHPPRWLEVDGKLYTAQDQDQVDRRRQIDDTRCGRIIQRLGGRDAYEAPIRITSHLRDERREALLAVIRAAGEFLVEERQEALGRHRDGAPCPGGGATARGRPDGAPDEEWSMRRQVGGRTVGA